MIAWGIVSKFPFLHAAPTEFSMNILSVLSMAFVKSFVGLLMYAFVD